MTGGRVAKPLALEAPVEIVVNEALLAVLMCTPFGLDELALGHAFCKGILGALGELVSLKVCDDRSAVRLECSRPPDGELRGPGQLIPSSCGSGGGGMQEAMALARRAAAGIHRALPGLSLPWLQACSREMFGQAELYRQTGGMHSAALIAVDGGQSGYFVVREDVGRHNAVDKVIGRGLMDGVDFSASVLLCSGRISADLMQKAAAASIPVLASRSIPTSSAYDLALVSGTAIVGRLGSAEPVVYTREELF